MKSFLAVIEPPAGNNAARHRHARDQSPEFRWMDLGELRQQHAHAHAHVANTRPDAAATAAALKARTKATVPRHPYDPRGIKVRSIQTDRYPRKHAAISRAAILNARDAESMSALSMIEHVHAPLQHSHVHGHGQPRKTENGTHR
jgi:hypothetical protein